MIGTFSLLATGVLTNNLLSNLKNRLRLGDGENAPPVLEDVTLGIPARNEAVNLGQLLPQIIAQRSRPRELIILDDGSSDATVAVATEFVGQHPWIRVVQGEPLPSGWRGKVWALEQILRQAKGSRVLFLDADVRLSKPNALGALWELHESRGGLTTVFPRAQVHRQAALLVDQVLTHLYYFLPAKLAQIKSSSAVAGCGQLMPVDTTQLKSVGGFLSLKASTHDGLQLARLYKRAANEVNMVDGSSHFECLFYRSFAEAFRGFSRNSFEATNSLVVTGFLCGVLFWVFVLPFVILPIIWMNPLWLMALLILLYGQFQIAKEFNLGLSHVPLTPVKASASIAVHLWGAARKQTGFACRLAWAGGLGSLNFEHGGNVKKNFMTKLSAVILTQIPISDQFGHQLAWQEFNKVPQVVIMAGKKAALDAKDWGIFLQKRFNLGIEPEPKSLQKLDEREKVKVIAVATLPDVPGIFKGMFRSGFRRESKFMGVALDFDAQLSKQFDYHADNPEPCLALVKPKSIETQVFCGSFQNTELRARVERAIEASLKL